MVRFLTTPKGEYAIDKRGEHHVAVLAFDSGVTYRFDNVQEAVQAAYNGDMVPAPEEVLSLGPEDAHSPEDRGLIDAEVGRIRKLGFRLPS
tara:strand:+ start:352 stop:624 length:273 start_codon:yes stop_codon:yes gene_type:complete